VACELSRYDIDIAALSETRLVEEWSLNEVGGGYTFFEVFFFSTTRCCRNIWYPQSQQANAWWRCAYLWPSPVMGQSCLLSVYVPTLTSDYLMTAL